MVSPGNSGKRDTGQVVNSGRETTHTGILSGIVQKHGVATSRSAAELLLLIDLTG